MSTRNQRVVVSCVLFLAIIGLTPVIAQVPTDSSFQVTPAVEIPIGDRSAVFNDGAAYRLGGSATFTGQMIMPNTPLLFLSAGLGYQVNATPGTAPPMHLLRAGVGTGVNVRVASRISVQAGIDAGWYVGMFGESLGSNPYAGGGLDFGIDLSPALTLTAGLGYRYYLGTDSNGDLTDLMQSARVSLGASLRPRGRDRTKVRIDEPRFNPVFPVFYGYYDQNTLGTVSITNGENSPISDVRVSFNVNEYMEQPKLSAEIPTLGRGESVDVDLHALFRSSVLQINTDTLVQAEIITEYTYLGERFTRAVPHTLRIHGRNSMTWDDDQKAASFVNPKDPTVLLFSKNTAGLIRENSNNPINLNFKIAMGIFEALRAYGMNYVVDPDSSYLELSDQATALDTLLFPAEALTYRAGDCDDLSILYTSLLESVGIETAFVTIPGHIYMAFSLGIDEEEARSEFSDISDLLFVDGTAWVPVETTLMTENFMKAWRIGARQWRDNSTKGTADVWPIHVAWQKYETAPTQTPPLSLVFPSTESIMAGFNENLQEFINREISGPVDRLEERIEQRGDSAVLRNRLGVLYARYGLYDQAEQQFRRATQVDANYVAPKVNLGNIAYLREDLDQALAWYQQAERQAPTSPSVLAGLARTRYELESFDQARQDYLRLIQQAPDAAVQYAYIGDQSGVAGRAASAQDRGRTLWEDAEDEE